MKTMKNVFSILCFITLLVISISSCGKDDNTDLQQFTVTFDTQGGSKVSALTILNGEKIAMPSQPTKEGYAFAGWYTESSYTHIWNFETDIVTHDITLYAKWEVAEFTATFNTNGGSNIAPQPIAKNARITRPLPPTKAGFVFDDWYKDQALTNKYDFSTQVTENITLYAKWTEAGAITKDLLQNLIDEAQSINRNKYTDDSYENLRNKINAATSIVNKQNPTSLEIQTAYQELNTAISNLVEVPYRATSGIEINRYIMNDFIYVNPTSSQPFYLNAWGVDSNGKESTKSEVIFEYTGLETWYQGDLEVGGNTIIFTINPSLNPGSTINIKIKSAEFPSITRTITLKAISNNEIKTLFINAVNALPDLNNITINNYDDVRKAVDTAGDLYYSLSTEQQQEPNIVAAYQKYRKCLFGMEDMRKYSYSFNGNICALKIDGETFYSDYSANGTFPAGSYTMKEWEKNDNLYYNYRIVLKADKTFQNYMRTANNPNGSNPSDWTMDGSGTYTYTGSQFSGGYLFMIDNHNEEDYYRHSFGKNTSGLKSIITKKNKTK